jgi:chromosome segregation ATPase
MNTSTAADLVQDLATLQRRNEHLEAMQVRNEQIQADQAQLIAELTESIRIVRDHRDELIVRSEEVTGLKVALSDVRGQLERREDQVIGYQQSLSQANARVTELENELAGARVIIEARDSRMVQLEVALKQRNQHIADASDAAEAYRMERDAARATIDAVGRLIDPQD